MDFTVQSLTAATWNDFVELFGDKGACGGCWCMYWRLKAAEYNKQKGEGNKKAMKELVKKNKSVGVLAYAGNKAVGWCAVAPRRDYIRLETSRILKQVDEQPVWCISCFFIQKDYRHKGLSKLLVKAAIEFAFSKGAKIVEAYPVEAKKGKLPDVFAWTGFSTVFIAAGFKEVERRSESRPIMRYHKKLNFLLCQQILLIGAGLLFA